MGNIFIGKIIAKKVKESHLSVAEFAKRINRSRTTVYDIFSRKSIDIELLMIISEALNYDFLYGNLSSRKAQHQAKKSVCFN